MHPLEGPAQQITWAGRNTAYNLGKLPADRLDWKPAPTAKSALEIINHVAYVTVGMTQLLRSGAWSDTEFRPAANLAEAQELITTASEEYAAALRQFSPAGLGGEAQLPWGVFPMARATLMPVMDLIHHHGQIAYLQTLLGDEEMHFYEEGE